MFGSRKNRVNSRKSEKRGFKGNQYTIPEDAGNVSSFSRKLNNSGTYDVYIDPTSSYCIINFALVFGTLQNIFKCKFCDGDIKFKKTAQRGLGFKLIVVCSCSEHSVNSCPMNGKKSNAYEINRRMVFIFRLLGLGLYGLNLFCGLMDLGTNFYSKLYYDLVEIIHNATKKVYDDCVEKAAEHGNERKNIRVSGDGSWAKRGFSSLIGFISLIGNYSGKVLDMIVKSSVCKACEYWATKKGTLAYDAWFEEHQENCCANHTGSAGLMEVTAIIEMFQRSQEKYDAKYAFYIGDGDTKTFTNLLESNPYDDLTVTKLECVNHVSKRMFHRLTEAKKKNTVKDKAIKQHEKKKAEEETMKKPNKKSSVRARKSKAIQSTEAAPKAKPSQAKKLTHKVIKDLSVYYGLAIRGHPDSMEEMKKEALASLYHSCSTDANPQHMYCPVGEDSWYSWSD